MVHGLDTIKRLNDEAVAASKPPAFDVSELLTWLYRREGQCEDAKAASSDTQKKTVAGAKATAYKEVQCFIEKRIGNS